MFVASAAFSPLSYCQAALYVISLASSSSIFTFASGCASPWCAPIGTFQTFRSRIIADRLVEREPAGADRVRGPCDPLRVEPVEQLEEAVALVADQVVGRYAHVVEEERELLLRRDDRDVDRMARQARRVGRHDEQRQAPACPLVLARACDDEHPFGLVHAGDVVLRALDQPLAAVPAGGGREVPRVRAGVGLGDGEDHLLPPRRDRRQPARLLLIGAECGDERAATRRRDDDPQHRAARRAELLAHDRELRHAETAAAVLLRKVDADEARLGDGIPELRRLLARARLFPEVGLAELRSDSGDGLAEEFLLAGLDEDHERTLPRRKAP